MIGASGRVPELLGGGWRWAAELEEAPGDVEGLGAPEATEEDNAHRPEEASGVYILQAGTAGGVQM